MLTDSPAGQPLRLLWLIDSLTLGGAESLVLPFARAINRSVIELQVCCLKSIGGNPVEEVLRDAGIPVVNLAARNLRDIAAFRRLVRLLREKRIQLVHAHLTYAVIWGVAAARLAKIPIIASLHTAPVTTAGFHRDSIREWLMMEFLKWPRASTVAVSESVRSAFLQKYSLPPNRIQVIYNGVKAVTFERRNIERSIQLKQKFRFPPDAKVLITVSVLRAAKGIEVLLRALSTVLRSVPEARLLIVGEGPMKDSWSRLAEHLGVSDRVHWAGYRKDVPALLAGSDLFVLASRQDAFPTVLLEAMAAELPIVASNVGGIPEILPSADVGVLVPPRDPAALAAAIMRLLDNEAGRRKQAMAARRRVAEEFPAERWLSRITTLYRQVVRRPERLRVAVVEFAGKGGLIHYAFQLCRAMTHEGADVTLLTDENYELEALEHPFNLKKILRLWDPKAENGDGGVRSARRVFRAFAYYREWMRLVKYLRSEQYDVVQFGDIRFPADLIALQLLGRRVPVLADICHNVRRFSIAGSFQVSTQSLRLYHRLYRLFDPIFVHYEVNRAEFEASFPHAAGRLRVIRHGNQELFGELRGRMMTANRIRSELGLLPGQEMVLFLGTLSTYKGIDLLIEAFASVALSHPRAHLVITGFALPDFNLESHLELSRGFGVEERVRILEGYVDSSAVAAWMEAATVAVFPYRDVHQSGALQIALTFGAPTVATRIGATPEMIEEGVTGLLVPPNDAAALAEAISSLLSDPELARRLGQSARLAAEQTSGWRGIAREILSVYRQQLERSAP